PDTAYHEADSLPWENGGRHVTFPHTVPADSNADYRGLPEFPFMDQVTLDLALEGVNRLDLGKGPPPDVLAVSLSATDYIGHMYGPDSRELHDQVLRLDRALGVFLDSLYKLRDSTKIIIALTGDHGVQSYPAAYTARTHKAAQNYDFRPQAREMRSALVARGADRDAFRFFEGMLFLNRPNLIQNGINPDSVLREFATMIRAQPGHPRVDLVSTLAKADTTVDFVARRWLHTLTPESGVEAVVTLPSRSVWEGTATAQHGSPQDDDAWVPVLFYGGPFKPGRYPAFTRVVDMAPTLAWVLGVRPTEALDGRILWSAIR
ncbi:MAG TPA: alkaline phosphatase family protein, partial [Gemmatimonadales bacterium]